MAATRHIYRGFTIDQFVHPDQTTFVVRLDRKIMGAFSTFARARHQIDLGLDHDEIPD